jgi:hypothetical protein
LLWSAEGIGKEPQPEVASPLSILRTSQVVVSWNRHNRNSAYYIAEFVKKLPDVIELVFLARKGQIAGKEDDVKGLQLSHRWVPQILPQCSLHRRPVGRVRASSQM